METTQQEFFAWVKFFQGADVTIGKGKTVWKFAAGWWEGNEAIGIGKVKLVRMMSRGIWEEPTHTTIVWTRIRLAS